MAVQTVVENTEVVLMQDPQANFVSLVKRGANKTPFRVVKNTKENAMSKKILHAVIAQKGVTEEALREALGAEVGGDIDLSKGVDAGKFSRYELCPRDVLKAGSLEFYALKEDRSIFAISGEAVDKEPGIVTKILNPVKKQAEYVGIPDDATPIEKNVLKSDLSSTMWSELDALFNGISGILQQDKGTAAEKYAMAEAMTKNFLASLEQVKDMFENEEFKADKPVAPEEEEKACGDKKPAKKGDEPKPAQKEDVVAFSPATPEEPVAKAAQPEAALPAEEAPAAPAALDIDAVTAIVEKAVAKQFEAMKGQTEKLDQLAEAVEKMQKAPAVVVSDHTEDGLVPADGKVQAQKGQNVFKGLFGDFSRR